MAAPRGFLILVEGVEFAHQDRFALDADAITLGRSPGCDVYLTESHVSRSHAELVWEGQSLVLLHRSERNPTLVNGTRVAERQALAHGDLIQLAVGVVLRVELGEGAVAAPALEPAPPPAPPREAPSRAASRPAAKAPREPAPGQALHVAIVGAGPAGLAAAVQAAKRGIPHTLLERAKLANTVVRYQKGKWVMDEPQRLPLQAELDVGFKAGSREEVLAEWVAAVERSGAHLAVGPEYELVGLEGSKGSFTLKLRGGSTLSCSHVVLAIGVQGNLRSFGVEGDHLPHVTYQLDDPAEHQGKRIAVVGAGDAAIENALALAEHDNDVFVVNRRDEFDRAKPRNRTDVRAAIDSGKLGYYKNSSVARFEPGAIVLRTEGGDERLPVDLVIGRLGAIAPRDFLEGLGVQFPSDGKALVPEVSESYETNLPGVHLVGALAGYPLIKNCMNQGYEVIEHILGKPVAPADEPLLREKFAGIRGSVSEILERIRRRLPIFAGLTTVQLREFLFDSEVQRLPKGETIFEYNEFTNTLFFILQGEVECEFPPKGELGPADTASGRSRAPRLRRLGRGEVFGEAGLLSGRRREATARAATDVLLIESSRLAMNKLVHSVEEVRRVIDAKFVEGMLEELLPKLAAGERQALAASAEIRRFEAGALLFAEGDEPDGLHYIRRGSVAISRMLDGRDRVIQYVQALNWIGERALLNPGRKRGASVRARLLTETVLLPTRCIVPLLERNPDLRLELARRDRENELGNASKRAAVDGSSTTIMPPGFADATDQLVIDESLCIRCDNCEKACAETHQGLSRLDRQGGPTRLRSDGSQLHIPTACYHCENPRCMEDCPPDALRRDPGGAVYIDTGKCIGCGNCVSNCPYGVIQLADVEAYQPPGLLWRVLFGAEPRRGTGADAAAAHRAVAVKCDLCRVLPKPRYGGTPAACVAACPTGAIVRVNPDALRRELQLRD